MSLNGTGTGMSAGLLSSAAYSDGASGRPSRAGTATTTSSSRDPDATAAAAAGGKNKLGTCNGVIIPCLLNIFGAILFGTCTQIC